MDRMRQDANAGGPSATDMLDMLTAAGAEHKPQMLADVAGENVKGLTGRIAREPGEGKQIIAKALNDRDIGAGSRLADDVNAGISGGGSAHDTVEALMQARSAAAQPRYGEGLCASAGMVAAPPGVHRRSRDAAGLASRHGTGAHRLGDQSAALRSDYAWCRSRPGRQCRVSYRAEHARARCRQARPRLDDRR